MRRIPLANAFERVLLGTPLRPFADGERVVVGRAQTRWGQWWSDHPRLAARARPHRDRLADGLPRVALGWSLDGANPWLWAMLLVAEAYGLWGLVILTWFSWRMPALERPPATPGQRVDVYVCTYDEPATVLRATLAGCAALSYPHTTYLLDDGRRSEVAALAAEWGAEYITRPDNAHAKAGNINHALPITGGDLVFMLDADHVPLPDALDEVIGYFDDAGVALVQTPHEFYNHDSIQHYEVGRHEQSVFYSVICPGKDRHNAAFWCGSGALIRRSALLGIGGVAVATIAEDFHTTIKLHRAGWKTRYHDEVLIQGLAPHDLAAYLLQRDRWARGNLAVFTTPESPLRARELSAAQRLSYFASLTAYLAGPMRLLMLLTLAAVVWSGQLPLTATPLTIGLLWAPATLLTIIAGSALCRGYQRIADTTHFELCTAQIFARALRCVVRPGRATFKVTPKEGVDLGGLAAIRQLSWVVAITALLAIGLVVRVLDEAGVPLVPNLPSGPGVLGRPAARPVRAAATRADARPRLAPPPAPHRVPHAARRAGDRDQPRRRPGAGLDARPLPVRPRPRARRAARPRGDRHGDLPGARARGRAHGQPRRRRAVVPRRRPARGRSARASSAATTRPSGASSSTATSSARSRGCAAPSSWRSRHRR